MQKTTMVLHESELKERRAGKHSLTEMENGEQDTGKCTEWAGGRDEERGLEGETRRGGVQGGSSKCASCHAVGECAPVSCICWRPQRPCLGVQG